MITKFLETKEGAIIISIILGLGFASMFRKVCENGKCIIYKGPSVEETNKYYYKMDDLCYRYTPYMVPCEKK